MRFSIPALVVLGVWFSPAYSAQQLNQFMSGCENGSTDLKCTWRAHALCLRPGMQGCDGYKWPDGYKPKAGSGSALPDNWSGLAPEKFDSQAAAYEKGLDDLAGNAQKCCTGDTSCLSGNNPATAARKRVADATAKQAAGAGKAGANGAATTAQNANNDGMIANSANAGACQAYKSLCQDMAKTIDGWSNDKTCAAGSANCNADAKKGALFSKADNCAKLDSKAADQSADQSQKAADKAGAAKQASDSNAAGGGGAGSGGGGGADTAEKGGGKGSKSAGGGDSGMGGLASMLPMAMQMMQAMQQQPEQQQQQQTATPLGCDKKDAYGNSVVAGCTGAVAASTATQPEQGSGTMGNSTSPSSANAFNVGDNGDAGVQPASVGGGGGGGTPITTHGVANGGGGGMPGAGGSGGGATLGGGGGGGGGGGAGKSNVPELRESGGPGGGGGLAGTNAAMSMQTGGSGGYNYGGGGTSDFERIPLADFLPGGSKYAGMGDGTTASLARGLAGVSGPGMQIQSKSVNIWVRISEQIQSRCAQGRLRDCGPGQ